MGLSHSYMCKKCDIDVIASIKDVKGMNSKVLAVKCNDCKAVGDSIIELHSDNNKETKEILPSCSECNSLNVIKWDRKCPTCSTNMVDNGLFMCWD